MTDELNKTQIAALIKLALEYNAAIIANASIIYGADMTQTNLKEAVNEFRRIGKDYQKDIETVIGDIEDDNN